MPTRKQAPRILIALVLAVMGIAALLAIPALLVGAPLLHGARPHTAHNVDLSGR